MEPAEIFDAVRGAYLHAFTKAVELQTNGYNEVLIQPCLNNDESDVPRATSARPFRVPMRQDIVPVRDGAPQAVIVVRGPEAAFLPLAWEYEDGFQLAIGPFTWDEARLVVFGLSNDADLTPLVRWFEEWADLKDEEEPDAEHGLRLLAHHVHRVEDPRISEGSAVFELDMGTAPADALTDFIDLLSQLGATTVVVGNYDQQEGAGDDDQRPENGNGHEGSSSC